MKHGPKEYSKNPRFALFCVYSVFHPWLIRILTAMLTPAEELGLSGLSLASRVRTCR